VCDQSQWDVFMIRVEAPLLIKYYKVIEDDLIYTCYKLVNYRFSKNY